MVQDSLWELPGSEPGDLSCSAQNPVTVTNTLFRLLLINNIIVKVQG